MTYALIDNATLTAVQRTTGAVAVKTSDTINGFCQRTQVESVVG